MKFGPVTKIDKRNTRTLKKFDDDMISENFDVTCIFTIYLQFGATRKPDSGGMVCNTNIVINSNLFSCKNWKQNIKSQLSYYRAVYYFEFAILKKHKVCFSKSVCGIFHVCSVSFLLKFIFLFNTEHGFLWLIESHNSF